MLQQQNGSHVQASISPVELLWYQMMYSNIRSKRNSAVAERPRDCVVETLKGSLEVIQGH